MEHYRYKIKMSSLPQSNISGTQKQKDNSDLEDGKTKNITSALYAKISGLQRDLDTSFFSFYAKISELQRYLDVATEENAFDGLEAHKSQMNGMDEEFNCYLLSALL